MKYKIPGFSNIYGVSFIEKIGTVAIIGQIRNKKQYVLRLADSSNIKAVKCKDI